MQRIYNAEGMGELEHTRSMLLKNISNVPGVRYRELLRSTGLSNGVLAYHLNVLERSYQIKVDRSKSKMTRYYPINITTEESDIIGYVRNNIERKIILFILENDLCTFNEITEHLQRSPSTISWHLKRLREGGIICLIAGEEYRLYRIMHPDVLSDVLYKYKETFVDKVVSSYIDAMEEL